MEQEKQNILNSLCYTYLVYGRIQKKLKISSSKEAIEKFIFTTINETPSEYFSKIGKNLYITNLRKNIRITINSHTYRVITVDSLPL